VGNTVNTITYSDNGGYHWIPTMSFCGGDSLEIRKVNAALDQPGRARGSLITGDPPVRPADWNDQVIEPCYSWNNGQVNFGRGPGVRLNEHYFNDTPMPGYTEFTYPHPLVSGQPMPTLPGSPPRATVKPPTTTTPGFTEGFHIKKKQNAETTKSKKIPGRPD
jgi:hypothetical protein